MLIVEALLHLTLISAFSFRFGSLFLARAHEQTEGSEQREKEDLFRKMVRPD